MLKATPLLPKWSELGRSIVNFQVIATPSGQFWYR